MGETNEVLRSVLSSSVALSDREELPREVSKSVGPWEGRGLGQEGATNDVKLFKWVKQRLNCSKAELKFFKIELRENYLMLMLAWYRYKVRNHLARKIFGEKYHQAYKKQHDYLFHYICKPMGAKVTESFEWFGGSPEVLEVLPSPYSTRRDAPNGSLSRAQEEAPSSA